MKTKSKPSKPSRADKAALTEIASRGFKHPKKTLATLKKAGLKSVAPFKLPTLAAFVKLPLIERTKVFAAWVKTQKGDYDYGSTSKCPLGQFGQAISGGYAEGSTDDFTVGSDRYQVSEKCFVCDYPHTFAALSQRLTAHLASS